MAFPSFIEVELDALTSSFPNPAFWPAGINRQMLVPILLANAVSYLLTGVLITRIALYLTRYRKDGRLLRSIVWALLVLNLSHSAVTLSRDIEVLGLGFGDWKVLGDFHSRPQDTAYWLIAVVVVSMSQSLIATRSFLFCRSLALAVGGLSKTKLAFVTLEVFFVVASFSAGFSAVIFRLQYRNSFQLEKLNSLSMAKSNPFILCEALWLICGSFADLSIGIGMWRDARNARTRSKSPADTAVQVFAGVALRCGLVLGTCQILLNTLYFVASSSWLDAAHSVLPRIASLTALYSITSPREAYRAHHRRLDREGPRPRTSSDAGGTTPRSRRSLGRPQLSTVGEKSELKLWKRGWGKKGSVVSLAGGVVVGRLDYAGGEKAAVVRTHGRAEEGSLAGAIGLLVGEDAEWEEVVGVMPAKLERQGRSGFAGGRVSFGANVRPKLTRSQFSVQTTSQVSVEVLEEGVEDPLALGNSVTIEGPISHHPPRPRSRLARLGSHSSLRRGQPTPTPSSSTRPLSSPDFLSSFPAGPTMSTSMGGYDEAMVEEMFDIELKRS